MTATQSRFNLGDFDGDAVMNGTLKIGSHKALHNKALMHGDKVMMVIEVEVSHKKGVLHHVNDGVLTRTHNAEVVRQFVIEDDDDRNNLIDIIHRMDVDDGDRMAEEMEFDDESVDVVLEEIAALPETTEPEAEDADIMEEAAEEWLEEMAEEAAEAESEDEAPELPDEDAAE